MLPLTQVSPKGLKKNNINEWNALGFFVLPQDTAESYAERVKSSLIPTEKEETKAARASVKACYDADPSWVEVVFSKKGLFPWEAGCTWYAENKNEMPLIQLHSVFEKQKKYLWLYDRDEILAHEYVHAVRSPLSSDVYEEFFSYFISTHFGSFFSRFLRVFFGPIFEHPRESLIFVVSLMSLMLVFLGQIWFFEETSYMVSWLVIGLMVGIPSYFVGRLSFRWWRWYRCKEHLDCLIGPQSLALMVRLLDDEIELFSRLSPEEIAKWISEKKQNNFRWQLLSFVYTQ